MASSQPETSEYEFEVQVMDTRLAADEVRQRLQQALREAIDAARRDEAEIAEAKAEVRGAFGGGIAIVFFVFKAFAGGLAGAAGKHFYEKYLKPRLESVQLFPSNLKSHNAGDRKS
jgi:regulator of protease activity HflC (stomatin/prohibitin superfamily)